MLLFWLLSLEAAVGLSPPAQARWSGKTPPIEVRLHANTLSMRGEAPIEIDVVSKGAPFAVSPFLQLTNGIAFEVTSDVGQPVAPAVPIIGSPPPPPLEANELVSVSRNSPFHVATREKTKAIFPRPGRYKVRARLIFFSFPSKPVRYAQVLSDTITVDITD